MEQDPLSVALRDLADRQTVPAAPVEQVLRRGRRAKRVRAAGLTAVGAAAAAVVAGALGIGGAAPPEPAPGVAVSSEAVLTPTMRLAAAADRTARNTFRLKWTYVISQRGGADAKEIYVGAFDPVHRRGYLNGPVSGMTQRFIGDDAYVWRGKWQKRPGRPTDAAVGTYGAPGQLSALELSTAPGTFLKKLQALGKVTYVGRSGSGGAAVERYSFTYANRARPRRARSRSPPT